MTEEVQRISTSVEVPFDEMEHFCEGITAGSADAAIGRIVHMFTPDTENLREQMRNLYAEHPLHGMIKVTMADEFPRARIGRVQDDEGGRLVMHMHRHMALESLFLRHAMNRLLARYSLTPESFVELLHRSEFFDVERKPLLVAGVKHYMAEEHASCAHLLIPQIEHLLRRLLESLGGVTVSFHSETQTYREKDLGTILRDSLIEQFWLAKAKRDVALYLRVLLTDQRGLNARNYICHGLYSADRFDFAITDRLMHILMLLSLLRVEQRPAACDDEVAVSSHEGHP